MVSSERIITLLQAHYKRNEEEFNSVALQIAAAESRAGHSVAAQEIKKVVEAFRKKKNLKLSFLNPALEDMMVERRDLYGIEDIVASDEIINKLRRIVNEYQLRGRLQQHGLQNRNKILLGGPSGTGKTMSATIIAYELELPLYVVRLDKILTKYMGASSAKLGQVFDIIDEHIGVYLFDEFDAIGIDRDKDNDVGEMRRVLTSFLQFIENVNSESIVVAATNHLESLDSALFRRFDDVVTFKLPDENEIKKLLDINIEDRLNNLEKKLVSQDMIGMSQAMVCSICSDALKESIITGKPVSSNMLRGLVSERTISKKELA